MAPIIFSRIRLEVIPLRQQLDHPLVPERCSPRHRSRPATSEEHGEMHVGGLRRYECLPSIECSLAAAALQGFSMHGPLLVEVDLGPDQAGASCSTISAGVISKLFFYSATP